MITGYEKRTREIFDKWSERYESGLFWKRFFHPLHCYLVEHFSPGPGERFLDIGCGTGSLARKLAERGAEVCGLDLGPKMLDVAQDLGGGILGLSFVFNIRVNNQHRHQLLHKE